MKRISRVSISLLLAIVPPSAVRADWQECKREPYLTYTVSSECKQYLSDELQDENCGSAIAVFVAPSEPVDCTITVHASSGGGIPLRGGRWTINSVGSHADATRNLRYRGYHDKELFRRRQKADFHGDLIIQFKLYDPGPYPFEAWERELNERMGYTDLMPVTIIDMNTRTDF